MLAAAPEVALGVRAMSDVGRGMERVGGGADLGSRVRPTSQNDDACKRDDANECRTEPHAPVFSLEGADLRCSP